MRAGVTIGAAFVGNSEGDAVDPFDGVSFGGAKGACAGVNVGVTDGKDDVTNDGMAIGD